MVASGLLEAMAALGLQAVVLASVLTSSTALAILTADAWQIQATLFAERQVEHLVDTAAARAGSGPTNPPAIAAATPDKVVFHADMNGDGVVDTSSSEKTEIEVRHPSSSAATLMHRLGNQGMTVEDALPAAARITFIDKHGALASAEHATGMTIPRRGTFLAVVVTARMP